MASRQPFSRHEPRGDGADDDGHGLVGTYEWASKEYGWTPTELEDRLTDEQLVAYLDAALDRTQREVDVRFRDRVEASRLGYLFAHDARSYAIWARNQPRPRRQSNVPSDDVIMAQIARLADLYPGNVIRGTMP